MRLLLIDPYRKTLEERDVAGSRGSFQRLLNGPLTFCAWIGADVVYAREHDESLEGFFLAETHLISGRAIVVGAGAGSECFRRPATTSSQDLANIVRFSSADFVVGRCVNGPKPETQEQFLHRICANAPGWARRP